MRKIFNKKDWKNILSILKEQHEVLLNSDYKGFELKVCVSSSRVKYFSNNTNLVLTIKDELGNEYSFMFKYCSDYETFHKRISELFTSFEIDYINRDCKSDVQIKEEDIKQQECVERDKFELLNQYIATGEENFLANCATYYNDMKHFSCALRKLIFAECENLASSQLKTAFLLKTVYDNKLYEFDGYKNIYDYASTEFNIARGTVSNWIMVAQNFGVLNEDSKLYKIDERLKDFTITQLILMRQLTIEQIEELKIKPDMTCKQIKQSVADKLNIVKIATSPSVDIDDDVIPFNNEDDSELYEDCEKADDVINSPIKNEKPRINMSVKGGKELSPTLLVLINKFLLAQKDNTEFELRFYSK